MTGAAGFIGGSLASRLVDLPETRLILTDKLNPDQGDEYFRTLISRPNVSFVQADLTMPERLDDLPRDIDIVFHGAAILGVQQVLDAPDRVLEINAASTLNVFNFARQLTWSQTDRICIQPAEAYAGHPEAFWNSISDTGKRANLCGRHQVSSHELCVEQGLRRSSRLCVAEIA